MPVGVADDRDPRETVALERAEGPVFAGRRGEAPVQVRSVADEVAPVAGGGLLPQRVGLRPELGERLDPEAADRPRLRIRRVEPTRRRRLAEEVARHRADPQQPRPDSPPRQVLPAEPPDEDRVGRRIRKGERDRRAGAGGRLLVHELEAREDPAAAVAGVGRDVDGHRDRLLPPVEPQPKEAHRRDSDDLPLVLGERDQLRAYGVPLEPPVELVVGHVRTPHGVHHPVERVPPLRRVPDGLDRHFVCVPSAALNTRRACVPATVSLNAIRSQAPRRTSSNVRGEYGSTL